MKRSVYYLLTLWILLWSQVVANHFAGGSWFPVDLILIGSIYFGLVRGPMAGVWIGFILGLLIDAGSLGALGQHAVLYAGAGYLAGMLRRQLDEGKPWTQGIFTLALSILYVIFFAALNHLFSSDVRPFSWRLATKPLTNAILAPLMFHLLLRWSIAWDFQAEDR